MRPSSKAANNHMTAYIENSKTYMGRVLSPTVVSNKTLEKLKKLREEQSKGA